MQDFKSGFVTIIGRTNVGKSTLLNNLIGEKIAIMTNKPQTTRTAIKGIINKENAQIIFTDTPGIHKPKTKLGKTMVDTAFEQTSDVDVIVFLIDASASHIGKGDSIILEQIKQLKIPTILAINKIDLIKKDILLEVIEKYNKEYDFSAVVPIAAINSEGVETLLKEIETLLKVGPAYYDMEEFTDQTERQIVEETIREKALKLLDEEVPHGILVEVENMKIRKNKRKARNLQYRSKHILFKKFS